jgi:hypothetical protein
VGPAAGHDEGPAKALGLVETLKVAIDKYDEAAQQATEPESDEAACARRRMA